MKKVKKNSIFGDEKLILIVSEDLNKLKGKNLAPKKLEKANKSLAKIKEWPPEFFKK